MIFLIRHGEASAAWGAHPNPGLSDRGKAQAEAAALKLSDFGVQRAVSSPMRRCMETAEAFCALSGIERKVLPTVSEIETPPEVDDRVNWLKSVMAGTWAEAGPRYLSWQADAVAAVSRLSPQTAVFSHFVAINAIVSALEGQDEVVVFRPGHCSITLLEHQTDGSLCVKQRGDEFTTNVL